MLRAQRLVLNQPQKRGEGGSGGGWREGGGGARAGKTLQEFNQC